MENLDEMIAAEEAEVVYRDITLKMGREILERLDELNKDIREIHKRDFVNVSRRIATDGTFELYISQRVR